MPKGFLLPLNLSKVLAGLPVPPAAGISAARQARVRVAATSTPGLVAMLRMISDCVARSATAVPAATPPATVARLNAEANRALAAPEVVEQLRLQGLDPVGGTPEQAAAWLKSEVAQWTKVIRDANIKGE